VPDADRAGMDNHQFAEAGRFGEAPMDLQLGSGRVIRRPTKEEILCHVEGEEFTILSIDPDSYIQCSQLNYLYGSPMLVHRRGAIHYEKGHYDLEYQDGSLDTHFQAVDRPITMDRVQSAFLKYLRGDQTWRSDFCWQKMDL
jgi:hypothetical protein